jgi:methylenetetrahydrofolate dehydrogenase (NADP+)/methenyltetrahydrofolate cyclohydrolase
MTATLIKGAEVAASIREELRAEVERLKEKHGVVPGLVTVLVGHNPASESYVRAKQKTAHELGFHSVQEDQPEDMAEESLLELVRRITPIRGSTASWSSCPCPPPSMRRAVLYALRSYEGMSMLSIP